MLIAVRAATNHVEALADFEAVLAVFKKTQHGDLIEKYLQWVASVAGLTSSSIVTTGDDDVADINPSDRQELRDIKDSEPNTSFGWAMVARRYLEMLALQYK